MNKRIDNIANDDEHDDGNQNPKFEVGDIVRISQRAFITDVREAYKSGKNMKYVYVKWSINTYVVHRWYQRAYANGFYKYAIRENPAQGVGNIIRNVDDNTISSFREDDLMQIDNVVGAELTLAQNNFLNKF